MTKKELHYEDLGISLSELFEQMGYGETVPDEITQKETERITEEVKAFLKSRFCFFVQREMPGFSIGKIIERQLKGTEAYALFICTAGQEYEDYMRLLKDEGDMVRVFIADALGSVIAEKTADRMEEVLQESIDKLGWRHTNRFSPGYCGWQVSQQQLLFPMFRGETCGVSLTESSLMVPIKSVSGIIGLGQTVKRLDYTCGLCDFKQCYKRKQRNRKSPQ
ncbi:MAG: methionine synthase [Prevotella sp.]|nr:methionine synthase [Prevotella sp.]